MKLLVYRYGGIGDTLTLTAFLAAMRPVASRVTLLGIAERLALVDRRLRDDIVAFDSVSRDIDRLAGEHDLSVAFSAGGFDRFTARFDPFPPSRMNIYRYMHDCAVSIGGLPLDHKPEPSTGRGGIVHPGSGSASKNAPLAWFLEQAATMEAPEFILGPAEPEAMDQAIRAAGFRVKRPDTLESLKSLIAARRNFLGNDAGPAHIAALAGLETRIRFVSSDPEIWLPPGRVTAC
jgi:hypothetical protein